MTTSPLARLLAMVAQVEADRAASSVGRRAPSSMGSALVDRVTQRLRELADATGDPVVAVASAQAALDHERLLGSDAPARWAEVATTWDDYGFRRLAMVARLRQAQAALSRQSERSQAATDLAEVHTMVAEAGSRLLAMAAERTARAAGVALSGESKSKARAAGAQQPGFAELTRREREVLELVATGATNRQVGTQLYISEKTASVHVSRILASSASPAARRPLASTASSAPAADGRRLLVALGCARAGGGSAVGWPVRWSVECGSGPRPRSTSRHAGRASAPRSGSRWSSGQCGASPRLIALVAVGGHPVGDTFRFDAAWYRSILAQGYHYDAPNTVQQNPAFPPGLPWLTEPFSWLLGDKWAAFLVANLTGLGAFVAVWWALRTWAGDRCARYGTIALALWPTSLYLWAFYSEGLFVAATAVGLGAERKGRRWLVVVCAVVAGVTRVVGLLFGPVLAVLHWWRVRRLDLTGFLYLAGGAVAAALVTGAQQVTTGHAFAAQELQRHAWHLSPAPPWVPIVDGVDKVLDKLPQPGPRGAPEPDGRARRRRRRRRGPRARPPGPLGVGAGGLGGGRVRGAAVHQGRVQPVPLCPGGLAGAGRRRSGDRSAGSMGAMGPRGDGRRRVGPAAPAMDDRRLRGLSGEAPRNAGRRTVRGSWSSRRWAAAVGETSPASTAACSFGSSAATRSSLRNRSVSPADSSLHSQAPGLPPAEGVERPRGAQRGRRGLGRRPRLGDAVAGGRGHQHDLGGDLLVLGPQKVQGVAEVGGGVVRRRARSPSALVTTHEVGELHDPPLDALQVVAAARRGQQHEQVDHVGHRHLALARRRRSRSAPRRTRPPRTAASPPGCGGPRRRASPPDGEGRMKASGSAASVLHAGLVAEDRAAAARARRVDRQHGDLVAGAGEVRAERLDERRLADAGRSADADPDRLAGAASTSFSSAAASARWSARVDSTSVMARASARRSPLSTCSAVGPVTCGLNGPAADRRDISGIGPSPESRNARRRGRRGLLTTSGAM